MSGGHHFPDEIILDICSRLPVKSVSRFRCVSKRFCTLLTNPSFIQMHLNRSIEKEKFNLLVCTLTDSLHSLSDDNESSVYSMASRSDSLVLSDFEVVENDYPFASQNSLVEIIGSCNGLVCLELNRRDVCIWNPATTEFKKIQTPPNEFKLFDSSSDSSPESSSLKGKGHSYGFGYDSKIGDYKLVRFQSCENVMYMSGGSIYKLETDTWKKVKAIRYDVSAGGQRGVHVNGILYWIGARTRCVGDNGWTCCTEIFSFDVCDESVHEIYLPESLVGSVVLSLGVFDGNLCLACDILGVHTEIWVLKDFGDNKGSWTRRFIIDNGINHGKLIHCFKMGEILFDLYRNEVDERNGIVLYDSKHKRSEVLKIGGTHKLFDVESYVPSLVSLKSGKFVGAREFEEL